MSGRRVAVLGATGLVGREMLLTLEQRNFPVSELVPLASERSEGKKVSSAAKRSPCAPSKKTPSRTWT